MVDVFPKKLEGEGMDYNHGSVFIGDPKIEYDTGNGFIEYVLCKNHRFICSCVNIYYNRNCICYKNIMKV